MSWKNYNWVLPKQGNDQSNVIDNILQNRFGMDFDVPDFLAADFSLYDPFLMQDVGRAVKRIIGAIDNNEKIVIFGDYDADGVTSAALLFDFFNFVGVEVEVYIPDRYEEGYGLKMASLQKISEEGADLLITVDCGIRDHDVISAIQKKGLDVIVTDHHNLGDKIPDCSAVVNPKRPNCQYPQKNLAGVGVAFVLVRALLDEMKVDNKKAEWFVKWSLDLVAIGTIADMVPLVGENRLLVKYGLIVLNRGARLGVRKLLSLTGKSLGDITARDVGYVIGPRLNAAGRISHAVNAFNLLTERSDLEAEYLAKNLNNSNVQRQEMTNKILSEAMNMIDPKNLPPAIFLARDGWSSGVVGLVCSRIVERFNRPAFIGGVADGKIKGSARSVDGINIVDCMQVAKGELDYFGGHDMAAGYTLPKSAWKTFKNKVGKCIASKSKQVDFKKDLLVDSVLGTSSINMSLWQEIRMLEPFGVANSEPILLLPSLFLLNKRVIGRDKTHAKLNFKLNDRRTIDGLWWRNADLVNRFLLDRPYDVAFKIDMNEYRGNQSVYMNIVDVRESS